MPLLSRGGASRDIKKNREATFFRGWGGAGQEIGFSLASSRRMRRLHNPKVLKTFRRSNRNSPTAAETLLWMNLRGAQLNGKKFRRQHGIGRYIVDFYCPECRVIVELDGAVHEDVIRQEYDAERTAFLEGLGIKVLRFENKVLRENLEGVLNTIRAALSEGEVS